MSESAIEYEEHIPELLTEDEAADILSVSPAEITRWAAEGLLPACARSERGTLLFRRWRVLKDGARLAAGELVRFKKLPRRRDHSMFHDVSSRPCGCCFASPRGDQTGHAPNCPIWLCADARALQMAAGLTAALAAAAPHDLFFARLAAVTRDALARHLGLAIDPASTAPTSPEPIALAAAPRLVPRIPAQP